MAAIEPEPWQRQAIAMRWAECSAGRVAFEESCAADGVARHTCWMTSGDMSRALIQKVLHESLDVVAACLFVNYVFVDDSSDQCIQSDGAFE